MKIDLHVHTDASDGTESVDVVFDRAAALGLDVLAITDHDTVSNWNPAISASARTGVGLIPGIEITTRAVFNDEHGDRKKVGMHMLAYLPDPSNAPLIHRLNETVDSRVARLQEITERIAVDYRLTWQDVLNQVKVGATLGRPSVADALIANGHFVERGEVFERLWFKGSPYYVPNRNVPDPLDAIELIRAAGGVAVLAHPLARGYAPMTGRDFPQAHFEQLIEAGLSGFEVYHPEISEDVRPWLLALTTKHDLIVTGSSDYHGVLGKKNELGQCSTSVEMLERIIEQATGFQPVNLAL
jgi:predicted metal-dependent phosphoesterase TrpH